MSDSKFPRLPWRAALLAALAAMLITGGLLAPKLLESCRDSLPDPRCRTDQALVVESGVAICRCKP